MLGKAIIMQNRQLSGREIAVWLLGAIYVAIQVAQVLTKNAIPSSAFNGIITISSFSAAIVHGSIRYGWRGIGMFALLTIVIGNVLENVSIVTGFPFGWYHYSEALGPQFVRVPLVIGPAYFSVGYLAWAVANAILGDGDRTVRGLDWLMLPIIAAFVMLGWDVAMDPLRSTAAGLWVWTRGGGYFGVPLSNFLGWYLTVFLANAGFARFLRIHPESVATDQRSAYWHQAAILFMACALPFLLAYASGSAAVVADARGVSWRVSDMQESAVLIALFTMIFAGVTAIFCVRAREERLQ
jgi:putative membrane protein